MPSSSAIEESTATFNCPKAIDDFVNESYNRMGIIDSIDFHQLNMNESQKPPSCCNQIDPIFPPNLIQAVDTVCLPPIGELFDPPTLDEIHQLLNSPSENSWKHEAMNIAGKTSKRNALSSFSRFENTRVICRMDKGIRFLIVKCCLNQWITNDRKQSHSFIYELYFVSYQKCTWRYSAIFKGPHLQTIYFTLLETGAENGGRVCK